MSKRKDYKSLLLKMQEDGGLILSNLTQKLNREIRIKFKCNCGEEYEKTIRMIVDSSGLFCKKCSRNNGNKKCKETNLQKYGVKNFFNSEKFKEKSKETCLKNHGVTHISYSKKHREKIKQTNLEKYGNVCSLHGEEIKEKVKKTWLEKYDTDYPSQNKEVKDKKKRTFFKKYGTEHPSQNEEIKRKIRQTNLEKYGNICSLHGKEIKEKVKQTNLKRYGVEYPAQNKKIFSKTKKSAFSKKKYQFKNNEIVEVQGYEFFALDLLQKQGYTFKEIEIESIEIQYQFNNKNCVHFPDIYLPKENRIIEVKSTWTYKKQLDKNIEKQKSCIKKGYKYEFWIFNKKGELTII